MEIDCDHWHIFCVRCNICYVFLDSSTNIVFFNDRSRFCHNCTYECSGCRTTIEDLPILTGDQAFCNACFKCQGCSKKKTEAFEYTETPQGIFCHECLRSGMPRRRGFLSENRPEQRIWNGVTSIQRHLSKRPPGSPPPIPPLLLEVAQGADSDESASDGSITPTVPSRGTHPMNFF